MTRFGAKSFVHALGSRLVGDWQKEKMYWQWVGRTRRRYDENMTNAIAVWDMVVDELPTGWDRS